MLPLQNNFTISLRFTETLQSKLSILKHTYFIKFSRHPHPQLRHNVCQNSLDQFLETHSRYFLEEMERPFQKLFIAFLFNSSSEAGNHSSRYSHLAFSNAKTTTNVNALYVKSYGTPWKPWASPNDMSLVSKKHCTSSMSCTSKPPTSPLCMKYMALSMSPFSTITFPGR